MPTKNPLDTPLEDAVSLSIAADLTGGIVYGSTAKISPGGRARRLPARTLSWRLGFLVEMAADEGCQRLQETAKQFPPHIPRRIVTKAHVR